MDCQGWHSAQGRRRPDSTLSLTSGSSSHVYFAPKHDVVTRYRPGAAYLELKRDGKQGVSKHGFHLQEVTVDGGKTVADLLSEIEWYGFVNDVMSRPDVTVRTYRCGLDR